MARPIYETNLDIEAEEWVARKMSERWKCDRWERNPSKYPIDISFMRGDVIVGFAEIKCRNVRRADFKTYIISADKIMSGRNLAAATKVPCMLVVCWQDDIGWLDMNKAEPVFVGYGGRLDRGDPQDVEPVIHYEISQFERSGGMTRLQWWDTEIKHASG